MRAVSGLIIRPVSSMVLLAPGVLAAGQCQPEWTGEFATTGLNFPPSALIWFDDGNGPALFAGGFFTTAGGAAANGAARWDGVNWESAATGLPGPALRLAVLDPGPGPALYAATVPGGVNGAVQLARWNGQQWASVGPHCPTTGLFWQGVTHPVVFDDGSTGPRVYLGTTYWSPNGFGNSGQVVRLGESVWTSITGTDTSFSDLAVFDDGGAERLYAAGFRRNPWAGNGGFLGAWDGAQWDVLAAPLPTPLIPNPEFSALLAHTHNGRPALIAAGRFSALNGVAASNVAAWDGAAWHALGDGMGGGTQPWALALTRHNDGTGPLFYIGGEFTLAGGRTANGVARWDGSNWSAMSGGVTTATGEPGWVGAFASAGPANGLYTGGAFASAGGTPSEMVARWGCGCYPDCTGDGALTVADFGCFQTKFAAANPYTDCTGDGALTVADFGCFQSAFVAGCP